MVSLLGATLPERKLVKVCPPSLPLFSSPALTSLPPLAQIAMLAYYGVSHSTASKIMARLQFHDQMRVSELSEAQLNSLSALLSAPAASPRPSTPIASFPLSSSTASTILPRDPPPPSSDVISNLVLEEDLRRQMRGDIAHHRTVGTLKGRQHAMGLPVRGQRNRTNGRTAKRLNKIERRGFATSAREEGRSRVLEMLGEVKWT
ncbi:hypothetical protein MNV49_004399 [Pseudohyphozyma bogoriensis]|nr:hypothetical protein MNV49_004399 [Pseudohyphozyma bogoriensis]